MGAQLSRVDVAVLPEGWTALGVRTPAVAGPTVAAAPAPEVSGSWSATLSPDGRHAAYVSDRSGAPRVWVQPVGSDLTFLVDTGEHPVVSVHWSTGGGWLACVLAPGGAPRTEVWLVRPDGSALHQVAGFGADTAEDPRWLPGRSLLALTENAARALLVDPVTGDRRVVSEGELITLLDVSPDGERVLLTRGTRGRQRLVVTDRGTGAERDLVPGEAGCFGPDGRTVYACTDGIGDLAALVRIDADGCVVLAGRPDAELEAFALSADGTRAALAWNVYGGTSRLSVLDLGSAVERPVPETGTVVSGPAWSADGSTLAFTAEAPDRPCGVWTYDAAGLHRVSDGPALDGAVIPELHRFAADDGLTLTGWLYRPAGDGPHPTVLWLHGGPEAQERPGHNPLFQSLVRRGVAVFTPNVRGSSGFGRAFVAADTGPLRYAAIADVAACVAYLVAAGVAEPGRIGCAGRSYGGYLTLAALVTYPELFAVGVDVCGMVNFATFYQHSEPWIGAAAVGKYGDPVADAELLRDLSPITRIDRLVAPLLVVHGANDTNVPVVEAEQVVAALRERGVPHAYLLFEGEGHELTRRDSRDAFQRACLDWLTVHLRVPVPA